MLWIISAAAVSARAQNGMQSGNPDLLIKVDDSGICTIRGVMKSGINTTNKNLSFVDFYADAENLASRIKNVIVFGDSGERVALTKFNDSEYVAESPFSGFSYEIELSEPEPLIAAPHVSWTDGRRMLLKMQDLLPQLEMKSGRIEFDADSKWIITTAETSAGRNVFQVDDIEDAVFLFAMESRTSFRQIGRAQVELTMTDAWQFEDKLAADMAQEILDEYKRLFGFIPRERIRINLLKFPGEIENDRWRAETQRNTITIVSSEAAYKNLAPQRLHEQLRHELFHLWIPEALNLEGDYAWFYEGFARYQSLKTGVWLGRLTFDDFLASMSEAINIASFDSSGLPLVELSEKQWVSGPGIVGAKGMSTAFLCDVLMLSESGGKDDIGELLAGLFRRSDAAADSSNALTSIEEIFSGHKSLNGLIEKHIRNNAEVDWHTILAPFDIQANKRGGRYFLTVKEKPKGRAKALLNKLGYNRWKKFRPRS